jgi:hypothetical protein
MNNNSRKLVEFIEYCLNHPEERFWQALRNWSGANFVLMGERDNEGKFYDLKDTFYLD